MAGNTSISDWVKRLWGAEINQTGIYSITAGTVWTVLIQYTGISYGFAFCNTYSTNQNTKCFTMVRSGGNWYEYYVGGWAYNESSENLSYHNTSTDLNSYISSSYTFVGYNSLAMSNKIDNFNIGKTRWGVLQLTVANGTTGFPLVRTNLFTFDPTKLQVRGIAQISLMAKVSANINENGNGFGVPFLCEVWMYTQTGKVYLDLQTATLPDNAYSSDIVFSDTGNLKCLCVVAVLPFVRIV